MCDLNKGLRVPKGISWRQKYYANERLRIITRTLDFARNDFEIAERKYKAILDKHREELEQINKILKG